MREGNGDKCVERELRGDCGEGVGDKCVGEGEGDCGEEVGERGETVCGRGWGRLWGGIKTSVWERGRGREDWRRERESVREGEGEEGVERER